MSNFHVTPPNRRARVRVPVRVRVGVKVGVSALGHSSENGLPTYTPSLPTGPR